MSLKDKIRDALLEPEDSKPKPKPVIIRDKSPETIPRTAVIPQFSHAVPTGIYQRLKERTDFAESVPGKILMKYLTPLESLPIEEHAKYKAAMAQAIAQERSFGVDRVLDAFDSLKKALVSEETEFQNSLTVQESTLADNQKQLADMESQVSQLRDAIAVTSGKIETAKADFQAALAARTAELDQQKAKYTELLK